MALSKIDISKMTTGTTPVTQGGTGLTSGTTDQFLKFTGTTTIASAVDNAGGLTLVASGTGSSVTQVNFDSVFTNAYKAYRFIGGFRPATNSEDLWFVFRSGGTTTTDSEYRYIIGAEIAESGSNSDARQSAWGQTYWKCSTNSQSNSSNFMQYVDMTIMNPMATSTTFGADDAHAFGTSLVYSWSSQVVVSQFGVNYQTNGNYDGLHMTFSSGNINAYNYQVYGYNPS